MVLGFTKTFEAHCDACGNSLEAILLQERQLIAYESVASFTRKDIRDIKKELLVVIHALNSWEHFLLRAYFDSTNKSSKYAFSRPQTKRQELRPSRSAYRFVVRPQAQTLITKNGQHLYKQKIRWWRWDVKKFNQDS